MNLLDFMSISFYFTVHLYMHEVEPQCSCFNTSKMNFQVKEKL